MRHVRIGLPALLCAGCIAAMPELAPPADEVTIFVHGYRGAFLKTEAPPHDIAWLTPGAAISGGSTTLARPFPGMRPVPVFEALLPAGPLTKITAIPWLWEQDVYLSFLEFGARDLPGFVAFSYDWRRDVRESAQKLQKIIDAYQAKHLGPIKLNLVAHSMGGLVVMHWLRYGTGDGSGAPTWEGARRTLKVVFLGTPFKGSAGIFDDLLQGTVTERNTALLSKEALFTFPSSFQLLPESGRFFVDASGAPSALDALDENAWLERGWSVFEDAKLATNNDYIWQLRRVLKANIDLHAGLRDLEGDAPATEALAIVGTGHPTVERWKTTVNGFDFAAPLTADGDDTVLASAANPPKPLNFRRFDTPADHLGMLRDATVQQEIVRFLKGAPAQ